MGNLSGFYQNYGNIKESSGSLPPGDYNVGIESAEAKPTKNDPNQGYLELKLKVLDGQHQGMYAPSIRLNLWNASDKAREIAEESLKSITLATNAGAIDDSSQLVGKTMQVTVRPQKNAPEYNESVNPKQIGSAPAIQNQFNPQGGFNPNGGNQGGFNPNGGNQGGGNQGGGAVPAFMPSQAAPAPQEQQPAYQPSFRP
ncbi:DUF669 domain-containing protein [Acidithiobacillus thiooxidans]|uniref:DUF669 domain-containing protein n=1 Tax=Acidithiobacillus thiooxidans TaxID=930 RepID=A0A1C2IG62_ACITH|nr:MULTISPECIES: DUF669 domain-containing protein [Acidithiobacillus]MBU2743591.1 DUF669 domain-containing protein [Acidithiobacillus albertensis]MBU2792418.1 DUF669 domain-containing protein [Acidithiobacillus thiooxidans]MBU2838737.1 DUF669 domain-containing protein [Acidithiobacillus thiooxidans]MBU2843203.1 DUF669 domain-containing protein [Acidithiobacillus thiooxidans]MDR7926392.1 DUF669 domain-containing protein [Acidithiobacillus thiooxidans]